MPLSLRNLKFVLMSILQIGSQKLGRTQEPEAITAQEGNVNDYNFVMGTPLALTYTVIWGLASKILPESARESAIDLCSGPGHFTIGLLNFLNFKQVQGVDLSEGMVKTATDNASRFGGRAKFDRGDIMNLSNFKNGQFSLSTFTNAAHHFSDIKDVSHVLKEMDRITSPDGVIMMADLVRLKSEDLTRAYIEFTKQQLEKVEFRPHFFEDFKNSIYAAWTVGELGKSIPENSSRNWYQLVPAGLPTFQIIIGVPAHQKNLFLVDDKQTAKVLKNQLPQHLQSDFVTVKLMLAVSAPKRIGLESNL